MSKQAQTRDEKRTPGFQATTNSQTSNESLTTKQVSKEDLVGSKQK